MNLRHYRKPAPRHGAHRRTCASSVRRAVLGIIFALLAPIYASAQVSDDFHSTTLNTNLWTFVNPLGDATLSMDGNHAVIHVPGGLNHQPWSPQDTAPRLLQNISNVDFEVEAKFDSAMSQRYQQQGILVEQDASNYIRAEVHFDGSAAHVFAMSAVADTPQPTNLYVTIPNAAPIWLRVKRTGSTWTVSWSTNGSSFTVAGTLTQAMIATRVGPFAANSSDTGSAPAFTVLVDYFFNTASPLGPAISGVGATATASTATVSWATSVASTSQVAYGLDLSYGLTASDPTMVTSHSVTLTGLSCDSTYQYSVASTDASGNKRSLAGFIFETGNCPGGGNGGTAPVSDDFHATTLNTSIWTFANPLGDATLGFDGQHVLITLPPNVEHKTATQIYTSPRLLENVANVDFEVQAKFDSLFKFANESEGITIEQDNENFIHLELFHDCTHTIVRAVSGSSGVVTDLGDVSTSNDGQPPLLLRLKRTGSTWTASYSTDGINFASYGTFSQALVVSRAGVYAGNAGAQAVGFTSAVDYFFNTAAPIATPPPPTAPVFDIWYGDSQTFGQNGIPQQWVNILGNVSGPNPISSLTYSLNGGSQQVLNVGLTSQGERLDEPGDFNVEMDYASLVPGTNTVILTATDAQAKQTKRTVSFQYFAGNTAPLPYTINWSSTQNIYSVAQVVDGKWQLQPGGTVRTREVGYDRLIDLGNMNGWSAYEVTAEVTIWGGKCVTDTGWAVGFVTGWTGHTTNQYGSPTTEQPRVGHPFTGAGLYGTNLQTQKNRLHIFENTNTHIETVLAEDTTYRQLSYGVKYMFKFNVKPNSSGGSLYSLRAWVEGTTEPTTWDVQANGELNQGSVLLISHEADVSFGTVTVNPVP